MSETIVPRDPGQATGIYLVCGHCGGRRRVLTFLTDPPVLRAILEHLGLPADPPAVARAPPDPELPFEC